MKGLFYIIISALAVTGCTTSTQELLPTNGSTMKDIWDKGASNNELHIYRSQNGRKLDPVNYIPNSEQRAYTRTAENEINNLFPRLPNPDLIMYIYPHQTNSGEPLSIPGYSTVLPFYGRVQYAQPGDSIRGL
ncbi:TIGR03751 family conjugal transfer lipoprotein [Mannheimia haemolytica]|uniref:Conjugative transfer region lipoprotein n=1 Tax=Mannheimia haemolytica TaxID=75985 RepID=A0A378NA79_MANHA|nr:TIGR03751 family conjugal transfer lipoprotein [Mannheimia haemolytica]TCS83674.1 conjugative transfer region lipoprotein (TIGR03751 family) [Mannheimia haemolytica]UQX71308.1 TIGR03751 family conjugal transfer lipoprotein [Mannheimia haemolytica]STY52255.1 conjugative transfer region lipoprotein [Mannheimia haemolytica]STY65361.1 conjugative transfer region lipoprotein [Mannheimia haemolytica]